MVYSSVYSLLYLIDIIHTVMYAISPCAFVMWQLITYLGYTQ